MSGIFSGIGLVSGINFVEVVDQLISLQRRPILVLDARVQVFQAQESALSTLEANLLTLTTSVQQLSLESTFNAFNVSNSDTASLSLTASDDVVPADYQFQAIRKAETHQVRSQGFADADQQTIGTGTITIASGGRLHQTTLLDALNVGNGVQRGNIQITDRSGATA